MLLRRYRLLLIVAGLTTLSILIDWYHYGSAAGGAGGSAGTARSADVYLLIESLKEQRLRDQRYDTYIAVYPGRPEMLFEQGLRAKKSGDDRQARDFFERAIATGFKTSENLYYEYALCLIRLQASQQEIDAATERWKTLFPLTQLGDPRQVKRNDNSQQGSRLWLGDAVNQP